jgi:hypothetical protein
MKITSFPPSLSSYFKWIIIPLISVHLPPLSRREFFIDVVMIRVGSIRIQVQFPVMVPVSIHMIARRQRTGLPPTAAIMVKVKASIPVVINIGIGVIVVVMIPPVAVRSPGLHANITSRDHHQHAKSDDRDNEPANYSSHSLSPIFQSH